MLFSVFSLEYDAMHSLKNSQEVVTYETAM